METAHARGSDPQTSHDAAASVNVRASQKKLLWLMFSEYPNTLTDSELIEAVRKAKIPMSDSGVRTRRRELVDKGLVRSHGLRKLPSGRHSQTWHITQAGRDLIKAALR